MSVKSKKQNNEKGITLLALVVTIIVLIILAGITISLLLGQNGIIVKAKEAKEASANAEEDTTEGLNNLDDEIKLLTAKKLSEVSTIKNAITEGAMPVTENIALKDDNSNIVTIPAGFKLASDSATKQEDGIVIEDKDGNQFVWIPVDNFSNYSRKDFGLRFNFQNYDFFIEKMPSKEQISVNTYLGYYIGRYEAGDGVSTASKTLRTSESSVTNAVSIKKGQTPYNWVTRDQAQVLAEGMKTTEGYNAETKLCSSYAWDTAINLIQNKVLNYGTISQQGNYEDTTFRYIDIAGAIQTKSLGSDILIPTGQTTPECNIYDMGGNEWEWTTEKCNYSDRNCVCRGGHYFSEYKDYPAGYRYNSSSTGTNGVGFRVTLYM